RLAQRIALAARRNPAEVNAIWDYGNFGRWHTTGDQPVPNAIAHGDNPLRAAVEGCFQSMQKADEPVFPHHAHGDNRIRPKVPYFEDPGTALHRRQPSSGKTGEELR